MGGHNQAHSRNSEMCRREGNHHLAHLRGQSRNAVMRVAPLCLYTASA